MKRATWTYIWSQGKAMPFEIRAGRKGQGRLLAGMWQRAYGGLSTEARIAAMEAAIRARGYTLASWDGVSGLASAHHAGASHATS